MADTPGLLAAAKYPGEVLRVGLSVSSGAADGWVLECRGHKPAPGAAGTPPAVAGDADAGWEVVFDLAEWPPGVWHYVVWRTNLDPVALLDVQIVIKPDNR